MEDNKKLNCPNCGSSNTDKKEIRGNNGVMGPGYSSWVQDSFFICQECGIRFEDLENETQQSEG